MPSIVVIAPYISTAESMFAGHQFEYRFLSGLSKRFDVTVVAPDNDDNRVALEQMSGHPYQALLSPRLSRHEDKVRKWLRTRGVHHLRDEVELPTVNGEVAGLIDRATAVGLSWSPAVTMSWSIRRRWPSKYIYAIEHDVSFTRTASTQERSDLRSTTKRQLKRRLVRHNEVHGLQGCDFYVVFKKADLDACVRAGVKSQGFVSAPLIEAPKGPRSPLIEAPIALFVGAFSRPENSLGAEWLLSEVWPKVVESHPSARLVLAGANPTPSMRAAESESVQVTGSVPDLDPYYRQATCAVAPVFQGGGIRVKVPQAMRYGLPLVGTPLALEGLEDLPDGVSPAPTEDPCEFAENILHVFSHTAEWATPAAKAQQWVSENFSFQRTVDVVTDRILARGD
jgi:glycosyltransferase involved in cell wall biosynthesis